MFLETVCTGFYSEDEAQEHEDTVSTRSLWKILAALFKCHSSTELCRLHTEKEFKLRFCILASWEEGGRGSCFHTWLYMCFLAISWPNLGYGTPDCWPAKLDGSSEGQAGFKVRGFLPVLVFFARTRLHVCVHGGLTVWIASKQPLEAASMECCHPMLLPSTETGTWDCRVGLGRRVSECGVSSFLVRAHLRSGPWPAFPERRLWHRT